MTPDEAWRRAVRALQGDIWEQGRIPTLDDALKAVAGEIEAAYREGAAAVIARLREPGDEWLQGIAEQVEPQWLDGTMMLAKAALRAAADALEAGDG